MPLSSGLSIHDDTKHKGSAKRDVNNGVAGIGAAGNLISPGARLDLARDPSDNITFRERTSVEPFMYFNRVGVADYKSYIQVGGVWIAIMDASYKNVSNGIAGLDASAKVPIVNLPDILPTGTLLPTGRATAPTGYLLCDGAAISRTTYAPLFAAIGDAYGVGDGSTTFNLPDMQGNIPVGIGGSGVTNLGDTGGEQTHTLIIAEMPAHEHNGYTTTAGAFMKVEASNGAVGATPTSSAGGDGAHENMQPYQGVNYIIKV